MNKLKPRTTKANGKKVKLPQPHAAIRDFLEKHGWRVFVVNNMRITQGSLKYNFHFEMDFSGSNPSLEDTSNK